MTFQGPFTGRHMLIIMVAFFGTIAAVNGTMAWLATSSWTGLVVPNSYVASQNFNKHLDAAATQRARGWQADIGYQNQKLVLSLKNAMGEPVMLEILRAHVGRPVAESYDRRLDMVYAGQGRYSVDAALAAGLWQVQIDGGTAAQPYRLEARFFVDSKGIGHLQ